MSKITKKPKEYVAFNGSKFVIEWYFDCKGHSGSLDYFVQMLFKGNLCCGDRQIQAVHFEEEIIP